MYEHDAGESSSVVKAGILSTREVSKNSPKYLLMANIFQNDNFLTYKSVFERCLNDLFLKIFDKDTPFSQTENEDNCKNCDFLHLCGRQTAVGN